MPQKEYLNVKEVKDPEGTVILSNVYNAENGELDFRTCTMLDGCGCAIGH